MDLASILQNPSVTELVVGIGTPAAGALWLATRKRLAAWRVAWARALIGLAALPGIRDDMAKISYFVAPNGGGSLSDAVHRVEATVSALAGKVEMVLHIMTAEDDADEYIGRFHCGPDGSNTFVNKLYARWMEVSKTDLLGWKFLNFIDPPDAERVKKLWDECREQFRICKFQTTLVSAGGQRHHVEVTATPMPENPPIQIWIGTIRKLDHDRRRTDRT